MTLSLNREFVRSYAYTDFKHDRTYKQRVKVMGRDYVKLGEYCAMAVVGDVYHILDSSDEHLNYVMLVGISRQHPDEYEAVGKKGIEIAAVNAKLNPIATIKLPNVPTGEFFDSLAENIINSFEPQFVRTKEEVAGRLTINGES